MKTKSYLLAIATLLLLHPVVAHGQPGSGTVRQHTFERPQAAQRGPDLGFTFAVRPGPGNVYTHPIVRSITSGSAAAAAGLMVGDTIVSVDGRDMRYETFFPVKVAGTRYVMLVRRGDEEIELTYTYPQADARPQHEGETRRPD